MKYIVLFERAADGSIWGYAPDLPGATGVGDTLDEAKVSVSQGIALWLEVAREHGEAIPAPAHIASDTVDIPAA
jgi:predicted RNase H-like HicB family nuclease